MNKKKLLYVIIAAVIIASYFPVYFEKAYYAGFIIFGFIITMINGFNKDKERDKENTAPVADPALFLEGNFISILGFSLLGTLIGLFLGRLTYKIISETK